MKKPNFYYLALPFSIVNGVVWGIGIVSLPLLAKTTSRAGLTFAIMMSIFQIKIKNIQ